MRVVDYALAAACMACVGCVRDPEPRLCPEVALGGIAVTEIQKGSSANPLGSWVELYNDSDVALDFRGLELRFRSNDGSDETNVIIRRELSVPAGGYATFGLFPDDGGRPAHVDYGFADSFDGAFPSAATLDVEACGVLIDRVQFSSLPSPGSYSFGGDVATQSPASQNDFPTMWCTDPVGTPKAANTPCP